MKNTFKDRVKVLPDGRAEYNGFIYLRKRYAYLVQAKSLGTHTKEQWISLCKKYNFRCCNCGSKVIGGIPTKDHIIPTVFGGSDSINNLQPLCRECNTNKGQGIIDYRYE
jgi:5-methylcytosine-specific restriction endonuclease McrA